MDTLFCDLPTTALKQFQEYGDTQGLSRCTVVRPGTERPSELGNVLSIHQTWTERANDGYNVSWVQSMQRDIIQVANVCRVECTNETALSRDGDDY